MDTKEADAVNPTAHVSSRTIDLTPTWGEWANIYAHLAVAGAAKSLAPLRKDLARATAAAQALGAINITLTPEQSVLVETIMQAEMAKQGFQ